MYISTFISVHLSNMYHYFTENVLDSRHLNNENSVSHTLILAFGKNRTCKKGSIQNGNEPLKMKKWTFFTSWISHSEAIYVTLHKTFSTQTKL